MMDNESSLTEKDLLAQILANTERTAIAMESLLALAGNEYKKPQGVEQKQDGTVVDHRSSAPIHDDDSLGMCRGYELQVGDKMIVGKQWEKVKEVVVEGSVVTVTTELGTIQVRSRDEWVAVANKEGVG